MTGSRGGEGRLSCYRRLQPLPTQPLSRLRGCLPSRAQALPPHHPGCWSQLSALGDEEEGCCASVSPTTSKGLLCCSQAEPLWVPLEFCRYHHTAPINSFFSLREGLAILAELVSGTRQAGENQQCLWGLEQRWVPGDICQQQRPSLSSLPTGSGELLGATPGQLHPAVPGAA